jgi:hypothetical protein
MGERDEYGLSATHTRTTHMPDDGEDDEEDFGTPSKNPFNSANSKSGSNYNKSINANSNKSTNSSFMDTINAIKAESASKKRKIGPKIEVTIYNGGEEGEDAEGDADAIDFSIGYPGSTVVKREEGGEIVDLTDEVGNDTGDFANDGTNKEKSQRGAKGKGKERVNMGAAGGIFNTKVKKEVIDLGDMGEDEDEDDEMVV